MEENNIIPDGWISEDYGDLIIEKRKSTLKVSDATNFGVYPFFTSGESILLHNEKQIEGENIFLATGGVANVKFHNGEVAYSTDTYAITAKEIINTKFLFYYSQNIINYINLNYFQGSGLKHLQKKDFKKHKVDFPKTVKEQTKIAEILSKIDKAISETETIIEKFNRIKTGLKKDLFSKGIDENGNVRYDDKDFKDTSWGKIPKNWICKSLGDCCYITKLAGYEFTKHIKYIDNGEIIALRAMNIKNEQLLLDDVQRISKNVSNYLVRSKLYNGDILITYIGAYIGDVVQIRENDKFHLAPNIAKIVAGNSLTSDFLENVLRTEIVRKQINALITTTANPSLTMGQIRKIQVFYPKDIEEQKRINSKLLNTNKYLENLKIELNKLKSIKAGLMQDLLSGKKRVTHLTN